MRKQAFFIIFIPLSRKNNKNPVTCEKISEESFNDKAEDEDDEDYDDINNALSINQSAPILIFILFIFFVN